jgi:hypothetical protein
VEYSYPQTVAAEIEQLGEESAAAVVQRWLGQPENPYIDFKTKDPKGISPRASVNDKRNLSKAMSGFGNSDGGLIVWGVEAKRTPDGEDVASELKPIVGLAIFHSDLNDLIRYATKPTVPGVVNYRVFEDKPGDRGYVVTLVPPGTHPPYRAEYDNNNHFYKRAGSQFYPMEPYDLRDVIFRQNYPKLEVALEGEDLDTSSHRDTFTHFACLFGTSCSASSRALNPSTYGTSTLIEPTNNLANVKGGDQVELGERPTSLLKVDQCLRQPPTVGALAWFSRAFGARNLLYDFRVDCVRVCFALCRCLKRLSPNPGVIVS